MAAEACWVAQTDLRVLGDTLAAVAPQPARTRQQQAVLRGVGAQLGVELAVGILQAVPLHAPNHATRQSASQQRDLSSKRMAGNSAYTAPRPLRCHIATRQRRLELPPHLVDHQVAPGHAGQAGPAGQEVACGAAGGSAQ